MAQDTGEIKTTATEETCVEVVRKWLIATTEVSWFEFFGAQGQQWGERSGPSGYLDMAEILRDSEDRKLCLEHRMSFSFQCRTCNETHEGLPSFGPDAPYSYAAMSELDRSKKAVLGSDNCIIENKQFFVRGRIELPIIESEESFVWLVWCSLSKESYVEWENAYELESRSHIGPFFGWLNTQLPFYEDSFNLASSVHLVDNFIRPIVEIHETDHPLFADQSAGISTAKAEQLVHDLLHHQ